MAEIFDREWDSLSDYDNRLLQIPHFSRHPEMLPYIGRHYPKTGILILGESHYLSGEEPNAEAKMEQWYEKNTKELQFIQPWNFMTRHVVRNYLMGRRTKAHRMFSHPAKTLIKAWQLENVNDSEAFTAFAFMNYFQRPATQEKESIQTTTDDERQAYDVLRQILTILSPKQVVFLSKKAYWAYCGFANPAEQKDIAVVNHPTSPQWYNKDGEKRLTEVFSGIERYDGFAKDGILRDEKAREIISKTDCEILKKHQRHFCEDRIMATLYPDSEKAGHVGEVVWHIVEDGRRFGVGYVVKRKILWLWDYDAEEYLAKDDLATRPRLDELYAQVLGLIAQF